MFSFISELLLLLRLMIISPKKPGKVLCLLELDHFPPKHFIGMIWFGWIIFRRNNPYETSRNLYNHERIHLDQATKLGSWLKFYFVYLWEWMISGFDCSSNPLELEAFRNQQNQYYEGGFWKNYKKKR